MIKRDLHYGSWYPPRVDGILSDGYWSKHICSGDPVQRLRADLDELVAFDVVGLPDAVLRSGLQELMARNQLDAVAAAWLASFDTRNLADGDACRTSAVWLRGYARCSDHAASGLVKRARLLHDLPAVAQAAGRGEVSAEHVDRICELAKQQPARPRTSTTAAPIIRRKVTTHAGGCHSRAAQ